MSKTIAFLGASGGIGLTALKQSLAAGHQCIALCRTPSKLTDVFPAETTPNLQVIQGNAHDVASVAKCLVASSSNGQDRLVDVVVSTIGGKFDMSSFSIDDPNVCAKVIATLLQAIKDARARLPAGATDDAANTTTPRVIVCSTTGISDYGRDVPLAFVPLYHVLLKIPHKDKKILENELIASGEAFTIVRPSLLTTGASDKVVRVGVEDPVKAKKRESAAIGYTISREDAGRWVADNLLLKDGQDYLNKIATITY